MNIDETFKNECINFLATLCMQNENKISIAGKIYCHLTYFRFLCRSRSHKRSQFNSKCGPTFSPPAAGGYIDSLNMSLSSKSIPNFWYYLRNIKDGLDNPEFGIFYDLMTRFMVLPVYCITRKNIFAC